MDQAAGLRARIEQIRRQSKVEQNSNTRLLAITSGKGGVGKTNFAVNLALALAEKKRRILLVDMDVGFGNVDLVLGTRPEFSLEHVLFGTRSFAESLALGPLGIHMIAAGSLESFLKLGERQVSHFVAKMELEWGNYDYVLFDTGAGMSETVLGCLLASPEIILVSTPEPTALADGYALLKSLQHQSLQGKVLHLVMNQVGDPLEAQRSIRSLQTMANTFLNAELRALTWIPRDPAVWKAVRRQTPLLLMGENSPAGKAIRDAAQTLDQMKRTNGKVRYAAAGFLRRWLSFLSN